MKRGRRIRREHVITYLFIFVLLGVSIFGLYFINNKFTGFAIYEQSNQSEFDEGTYNNVEYNGSAVVLSSGQTSGTYTSKIFDAGGDALWNNISWSENKPDLESLFCVDGGGDIYQSTNAGVTWTMSQEDFGRTTVTEDMFSNSDYLYILSSIGNEVWRSADGTSFAVVYNDFDGKSPLVGDSDDDGNLYVITGPGKVWKSTNLGITWTEQGDFNGDSTNDPKGISIDSNGYIFAVGSAGKIFKSVDSGQNWEKVNEGYGGSTGTDGMDEDSTDNLYILLNIQLYKSGDSGVTWDVINDSISPYANTLVEILIDSEDNFFILDALGRVFKSTDYGITWIEIGDCNNDATNDPKGITDFIQNTNLDFQVKSCDDSSCSGESWIDITDTSPQDLSVSDNQYFQYKINFTSPDSSITPILESVSIDYVLVNQAPLITLVSPQDGATYGYNESLALNFIVSDSDDNLDSCWYNIDGGDNVILTGCVNTTFDVPDDGTYTLTIYANDTQGEQTSDSATFNVQVGAPTIELSYPIGVYLTNYDIIFRYIPIDMDLDSCELLGNFNGNWEVNQTDNSPTSGSENTFSLTLQDGTYLWNIQCNDSLGNFATNGNKTFYIDSVAPEISLTEPTGTKSSRTINAEWGVSDDNLNSCWYNVYRGESLETANTSVNCSLESTTFEVTVDADFIFNFYVNDSAGNSNSASSSFSVDTSSSPPPSNGGGSSGGSSGGGSVILPRITKLTVDEISNLIVNPKDIKKISWDVKNTGTNFLNDCKFKSVGEFSSWIDYTETRNLAAGEEYEFVFDLNVPESAESGKYDLGVALECNEITESFDFVVEIIEKKLNFNLVKVERISKEEVNVIYSLEELSGIEQNIELQFLLFGSDNEKAAEIKENKIISANSKQEFEILIPIDSSLEGELSLLINLNSETYSTFVQENIILGSPISGFAVFGESGSVDNVVSIGLIILFSVFAFFVVRRILKHKKKK